MKNANSSENLLNRLDRMVSLAERIKKRHTSLLSKSGTTAGFSFSVVLDRNRSLISQKVKNITRLLPEQSRIQPFSLTLFSGSISQNRMPSTWEPLDFIYAWSSFQAFKDVLPVNEVSPTNIGSTSFIQSILAEKNVPGVLPTEPQVKSQAPVHGIENHPPFKGKLSEINSNPQPPTLRKTPGTTPQIHQDKRPELSSGVTRKTLPGITFQKSYPQADIPKGSIGSLNSIKEPLKNIEPLIILKQPEMQETLNNIEKASPDLFSKQPIKSDTEKEKAANINLSRQLPSTDIPITNDIPVSKPVKESRFISKKQKDKPLSIHRKVKQKYYNPGIASYLKQEKIELSPTIKFANAAIVQRHNEGLIISVLPSKIKQEFTPKDIPGIELKEDDRLVEEIIENQPDRSLPVISQYIDIEHPSDVPVVRPAEARTLSLSRFVSENQRNIPSRNLNNAASQKSDVNPLIPLIKYSSATALALKIDRKPAIISNNYISSIIKNSISQKAIAPRFKPTDKNNPNIPGITVFPEIRSEILFQSILRLSQETPNLPPDSAKPIDAPFNYPDLFEQRLTPNKYSRQPEKLLSFTPTQPNHKKLINKAVQRQISYGTVPGAYLNNSLEPEESVSDEAIKGISETNLYKEKRVRAITPKSDSSHITASPGGTSGSRPEIKLSGGEDIPDIIKIWSQKEPNRVSPDSDKPEPLVEPTRLKKPIAENKIQPKMENQSFVQPSQIGSIENKQTGEATQSSEEVEQDIDELARKVYGIIKKRLARDRERLMGLN